MAVTHAYLVELYDVILLLILSIMFYSDTTFMVVWEVYLQYDT